MQFPTSHSRLPLSRLLVALLLALCCLAAVTAQVNFSPSWGKRGAGQQDVCKPSMDSLMYLYKLIQDEAQKMMDCDKFGN